MDAVKAGSSGRRAWLGFGHHIYPSEGCPQQGTACGLQACAARALLPDSSTWWWSLLQPSELPPYTYHTGGADWTRVCPIKPTTCLGAELELTVVGISPEQRKRGE